MTDPHKKFLLFIGLFCLPAVLLVGWGSGLWYQQQISLLAQQVIATELTQLRNNYDQELVALQAEAQDYAKSLPGAPAATKTSAALPSTPGLQLYTLANGNVAQLWPAAPLPRLPHLPPSLAQMSEEQTGILLLDDSPYLLASIYTRDAWLLALRPFAASELQLPAALTRVALSRTGLNQDASAGQDTDTYLLPLASLDGSSLALAVTPVMGAFNGGSAGLSLPAIALMLLGLGLLGWGYLWLRQRHLAPQQELALEFARHDPAAGPFKMQGLEAGDELQALVDTANRWLRLVTDTRAESLAMLDALSDGVIVTDTDGRVRYANRAATELLDAGNRPLTGEQLEELIGLEPKDIADFSLTGQQLRRQQRLKFSHRLLRCHLSRIQAAEGGTQGVMVALADISEQVQNEAELHRLTIRSQAQTDPVTGLLNRSGFEALLAKGMDHTGTVTLCSLNLEQFKLINDNCGHSEGDRMLELVGRTLQSNLGPRDAVARLDGDDFAILMPDRSAQEVAMVVKELQRQLSMLALNCNGLSYRVGVSIGVAFVGAVESPLGEYVKDAQIACQAAKRKGSNQIHVYDDKDTELNHERHAPEWAMRMANAIHSDELELFFQPIKPLGSANPRQRLEVLLRIREPDGRLLSPGQFIASAERFKLMPQVDKAVIALTMAFLSARPGLWQDHCLSINLSGNSLGAEGMEAFIMTELNRHGIPANCLCFEITETTALQNRQRTLAMLRRLRQQGFAFAIDDFGSGFASYGYLRELPVDYVKIDGCFVRQLADNVKDYAIVKSIHDVCTVMGIETVAEFVESQLIINKLEEIGVNYIQGYAVGRPKPLSEYAIAFPMGRRA